MVILDTDHVSLLAHEHSPATSHLRMRLAALAEEEVATTIVTYEEQSRGWLAVLRRARSLAQQIDAYGKLFDHAIRFQKYRLLPFDTAAAVEFERLKSLKLRVGTQDLRIAAIAIARHAKLLTRNLRDFQRISGLQMEDWSQAS